MNNKSLALKATTVLGSAQVIKILAGIVVVKFISVFVGPAGIGYNGLLQSIMVLAIGISGIGITTSGVQALSSVISKDPTEFKKLTSIVKSLVDIISYLGVLLMVVLSPIIAYYAFSDIGNLWTVIYLSLAVYFTQKSSFFQILYQSKNQIGKIGKITLVTSLVFIVLSASLIYFFRINGILPSIITLSILTYMFNRLYYDKDIKISKISLVKSLIVGKPILQYGFIFALGGFMHLFVAFALRTYISSIANLTELGLFVAGITLVNAYVGVVFSAMATDYFPRLCNIKTKDGIIDACSSQGEVALLIVSPLIGVLLTYRDLIITILYSDAFLEIGFFIVFGALGLFFKALSWCKAYIILANRDMKLFLLSEFLSALLMLYLIIAGYNLHGLDGAGFGLLLLNIIYFLAIEIVVIIKYKISFNRNTYFTFFTTLIFSLTIALNIFIFKMLYFNEVVIFIAILYSSFKLFKLFKN